MLWSPGADAPRNVDALAAYIDQRFGELSRALDTFKIFPENYTPVWTHSVSSNPVVGNGSLLAHSLRFGGIAFVQLRLKIGSTTTFEGTANPGRWEFTVPWACEGDLTEYVGSALVLDNGTAWPTGNCKIVDGDTHVEVYLGSASDGARKDTPMTWTTDDELRLSIMYPVRD